jgi:cold shock CspA family protein
MTMATGSIIFFKDTDKGGFGFIKTDDAPTIREANVWFGRRALRYDEPRTGDRVSYTLMKYTGPVTTEKGPSAYAVELLDDSNSVETIGGE